MNVFIFQNLQGLPAVGGRKSHAEAGVQREMCIRDRYRRMEVMFRHICVTGLVRPSSAMAAMEDRELSRKCGFICDCRASIWACPLYTSTPSVLHSAARWKKSAETVSCPA